MAIGCGDTVQKLDLVVKRLSSLGAPKAWVGQSVASVCNSCSKKHFPKIYGSLIMDLCGVL